MWQHEDTGTSRPTPMTSQRGNGGGATLVKGHAKKLFPRGHPQTCVQVDQVCCEAGGLCRKIRHKQFL